MAVVLETSIGEMTIDLYTDERPRCCTNFLKLCKIKYYNFCLFHSIQSKLVAQTGDPTGTGNGGASVYAKLYGDQARYFDAELKPKIKHKKRGLISMVNNGEHKHGSQFFLTLGDNIDYLDGKHTVFGEVSEGFETIDKLNDVFVDQENRPYKDVRIYHTVVLDDPFDDPPGLADHIPASSPVPTKEQLDSGRIGAEEDIDDFKGKSHEEIEEILATRQAKANAQLLEMVGDLPDADVAPPENVLFVCKLNPVTTDEDLEIIFSRFGPIVNCEVIKDQKTQESLQYAFIEFEEEEHCANAYFKMDNVLIDDRRIHVDFSQSVSKLKYADWRKRQQAKEGPQFVIKDRARKDQYDLVFSDKEDEDGGSSKKKKKKKDKKKHRQRSPSPEPQKRKRSRSPKKSRDNRRSRSPSPQRSRGHRRSRSPSPVKSRGHRRSRSPSPPPRSRGHQRSRSPSPQKSRSNRRSRSKERSRSDKRRRSNSRDRDYYRDRR